MQYTGFIIRRERLRKDWSQEGLCLGICTVSYLSKIEQGKAEPSAEITALLMERMGIEWDNSPETAALADDAWDAVLSGDNERFRTIASGDIWPRLDMSPFAPDKMLLECIVNNASPDAGEELEICLTRRQLAILRVLQGCEDEALRLFPCALTFLHAGINKYSRGLTAQALELFAKSYEIASSDGYVRIMLAARTYMGNCYSDKHDIPAMESHYAVAMRLAEALKEENYLATIPYNIAATRIEVGDYGRALEYFENLTDQRALSLHKLAICYEKTGQREKALAAIDRAMEKNRENDFEQLVYDICRLVKLRLMNKDYLRSGEYENLLFAVFNQCRSQLALGYAIFHLPWVLEWYEAHRLYKQAYALLREFPEVTCNGAT